MVGMVDTVGLKPIAERRASSNLAGGTMLDPNFGDGDRPSTQPVIRVCTLCGTAMQEEIHCNDMPTQEVTLAVGHNYDKNNIWGATKGFAGRREATRKGLDKVYHGKLVLTWTEKEPEERVADRAHSLTKT